jgi:hypothetical protein
LRRDPKNKGPPNADERRRNEAKQQKLLQSESSDQNRGGYRSNHVTQRQRTCQDSENSLIEVKVSEIEVEKKEEKPETKVEKECCSKK